MRSSVCLDDYSEADQDKLEGTIDALDMIAVAAGVGDDEWQKNECKAYLKRAARLATTPYCSPSSCAPLGFCDSDCVTGRDFCGRLTDYDGVLELVLPGGQFHAVLGGMVGADVLPCTVELLQLVSGGGDDSKICNSSSSTFSNMAFGSTPYVDCLPLSVDDPNIFLRDPSSPSGSCTLSTWDEYDADIAAMEVHNAGLLLNATLAAEEPLPTHPWWRSVVLSALPLVQALLVFLGRVLAKGKEQEENMAAVLDGIQKDSSRLAQNLRFRDYFGISGVFVAVALTAQTCLAVILGFRAEAAGIPAVQVVCLHGIAVFAASKLINAAVYWRSLVEALFDVQEGHVDPLEAWNKIPAAKRLKKWYNANFAIHTGGKYSLLLIIGAEVFELTVQAANANFMAGSLDWPALSFYGTLISTNCIVFGICMLSDERFVSDSVIITVDVVMDACYIMFNILYVSNPASYWAIIVPLALSVNTLFKGFKREGLESVKHTMFKRNVERKNDESKANGTFEYDAIVGLAKRFNAGAENNRREIRPPSGFDEFAPRLFAEDSGDVAADTLTMEFVVPGVSPGQAFTFDHGYTSEEHGGEPDEVLQVFSKTHRVSHVKQSNSTLACCTSRRDFVGDTVWKKLELEDGSNMFLSVSQPCEHPDALHEKEFIRGALHLGRKYEGAAGGTKISLLITIGPGGLFPAAMVNFAIQGQMKARLQSYKKYFLYNTSPDGSIMLGAFPDDENMYNYKFEGEEARGRGGGSAKIREVIRMQSKAGDELVELPEAPAENQRRQARKTAPRTAQKTVLKAIPTLFKKPTLVNLQEIALRDVVKSRVPDALLKDPIKKLRRFLGWFFLLVGVGLVTYVSTRGGRQEKLCEEEFGECVWGQMEPKLYFKDGLLAKSTCGFGVDKNPNEDVWELDVSGCELKELGGWREAFADLEVLDLSDNELAELPGWLEGGGMEKLRELRARNNKLRNFTFVDWRESVSGVNSTTLEVVDLRDNEIAELPYDVMDVEGEGLRLLFDGNPCAEEVDWSGLGKDRLPARMGVGYDNGGFGGSLRVLKMGRNRLDESVFEELMNAGFVNITDLDVSWNELGRIREEVRGQEKLRRLDVSGNSKVGARDLVAAPPDLEMLNASFCGVDDITGEQAVELQDRNVVLHGNPMTEITWFAQNQLTKIPAWLQTLEKVTYADLGYCDVKEIKGDDFPASLEELNIQNQVAGLRLHPDSFEGLSKMRRLDIGTNKLTEDDMHPGLFGGTELEWLVIMGSPDMLNFDAAALFPGSSGQQLGELTLENCGLIGIGGESGTNFHGLLALEQLDLKENNFGDGIAVDAFGGLERLTKLLLDDSGLTFLPARVFSGLLALERLYLHWNVGLALPEGVFSELCSLIFLGLNGAGSNAFTDNAFAGWPYCLRIDGAGGEGVRDMCEAQQDVFVEGSCTDQLCETGDCSACNSEGTCGSYGWFVDEASALEATLMNGASCAADGVAFDGVDDYVDLDDWEWGGAFTIEVHVKPESFNWNSRVLDFGSGPNSDGFLMQSNDEATNGFKLSVRRGSATKWLGGDDFWELEGWTHAVVSVSGASVEVYKNGELVRQHTNWHGPTVLTRTQHWLGRSQWPGDAFFHGSIAYVRMWHGVGLGGADVHALYNDL
ncbi:hypothetical protein TeGR_g6113 [Tetraparma gracilis]|uniref:Uncharacterized protein n=1 Tax=Tetraparma gracilis TaxID=2962635 RepID=A0ABQ6MEH5_9STRA|nr:hypothetical protein TeGR_g6113 [Tetraparma gracilis]